MGIPGFNRDFRLDRFIEKRRKESSYNVNGS
jgi:hypothetical protein